MFPVGGRSGAPMSKRAGQWLIGVEVAFALVLMTGAGLILRSFANLVSLDFGFDGANVLTFEVEPLDQWRPSGATTTRRWPMRCEELQKSLPQVRSISMR